MADDDTRSYHGEEVKRWKDLGGAENLPAGARVRPMRRSDFVPHKMVIECPHCQRMLEVIEADGPFGSVNPTSGEPDNFWLLLLSDGFGARFWEDGKGIIE